MVGYYGGIRLDTVGYSVNMMGYYGGIPGCVSGDHRGDTCTPHLLFPPVHYSVDEPHWKTTPWPPTCDKADGDGAAAE